jgi:hypothetical protein
MRRAIVRYPDFTEAAFAASVAAAAAAAAAIAALAKATPDDWSGIGSTPGVGSGGGSGRETRGSVRVI